MASWEDSVAWLHDRVTFPEGEHPTAYQEELLGAIATHKRASGRGSHGLGKTAIGAWALLWFADTRDKARADWKAMRALEDAGPWDVPAHQAPAPGRPWAAPITHAHEENADCQRRTPRDVYPRCASPTSGMAPGGTAMADDNPMVTEAERAQQRVDARQVGKHAPAADDEGQDRNSERLEVGPMDQMTVQAEGEALEMRDGEDFVCPNCGCEILLKHHGDPAKMPEMGAFRCCCGTAMHPEHPREH